MYSLRRTLAVRFSITIFIALLFIAVWAYLGAQRILREELDHGLAAVAQLEFAVIGAGFPIALHAEPSDMDGFIDVVNRFVVVRDVDAAVLAVNTPLANNLPLDPEGFEQARRGRQVWMTQDWGDDEIRSYYGSVDLSRNRGQVVVQVAASLQPLSAANREVLFLLLGTVLLGSAASALGAGWLASSSVTPVDEITQQAQGIQPGMIGQRITEHADIVEFAGLVKVLNGMLERLDRTFETQRRMIADAGHDLRTPLTAMQGEIEVALRGERSPADYKATLVSVLEEVDHLVSISDSLVLLARLDAGTLSAERIERDVADLVQRSALRAQARAEGKRDVTFTGPDGGATAAVDAKMLTVAVDHLLDNAIKHTPDGTSVHVSVTARDGDLTITVEDDGPGLSEETLSHLFERFYRTDEARSRTGAAGLGLTIVAAIVSAHSGKVRADASDRGGLRVSMDIPRQPPAA
ncbi:MAG: ATP-binding protein [Gemmatimonadales bacterium]